MPPSRPIHPDFQFFLDLKDQELIDLFMDIRKYILELCPECNELVYHTHALTAVFSISDKLSDAFCLLPIYKNHLKCQDSFFLLRITFVFGSDYEVRNPLTFWYLDPPETA